MTSATRIGLAALVAAMLAAGAWYWREQVRLPDGVMLMAGGDAGGLARAEPAAEGFDAAAVKAAMDLAREQRATALLVMRHEHLVIEQYGGDGGPEALVDGGELATTLARLASVAGPGTAAASTIPRALASAGDPQVLSARIWRPLNAAPAQYVSSTGQIRARASDWLRVAGLLLQDGRFEGTQVLPGGVVRRVPLASLDADTQLLRGPGGTRLWVVPHLALAVLRVGPESVTGGVDETRLPALLAGALRERPAATGPSLGDLVTGH